MANEIKELAHQTADATKENRQQIDSIQHSAGATVTEIRQITELINKVDTIVAQIAVSVEEQSTTTKAISENVVQAALGIGEVNENIAKSSTFADNIAQDIGDVSQSAITIAQHGTQVKERSKELQTVADRLYDLIKSFKVDQGEINRTARNIVPENIQDLIHWGPDLMIGVEKVDDQHKVWVQIINDLHRSMKGQQGINAFQKIMDKLVDYTIMHFSMEEKIFD